MIPYKVLCDDIVVLDNENDIYWLEDAPWEQKIEDGMFTGEFSFTIMPDAPAYDAIHLRTTTVYIFDGGKEVYRGCPTRITVDKYLRKKVECESILEFLKDIPDVFSPETKSETRYYLGWTEEVEGTDGKVEVEVTQTEAMTEIPSKLVGYRKVTDDDIENSKEHDGKVDPSANGWYERGGDPGVLPYVPHNTYRRTKDEEIQYPQVASLPQRKNYYIPVYSRDSKYFTPVRRKKPVKLAVEVGPDNFSRFNEADVCKNRYVHRSFITFSNERKDENWRRVGNDTNTHDSGRSTYSDYGIRDYCCAGKNFDITYIDNTSGLVHKFYGMKMLTAPYQVTTIRGKGAYGGGGYHKDMYIANGVLCYLGNIHLIFPDIEMDENELIDIGGGNTVKRGDLTFCVVQYSDAPSFWVIFNSHSGEYLSCWSNISETVVYAIPEGETFTEVSLPENPAAESNPGVIPEDDGDLLPTGPNPRLSGWYEKITSGGIDSYIPTTDYVAFPGTTYYTDNFSGVDILVKMTNGGSIAGMVNAILCDPKPNDEELYGYNAIVPEQRRIYRGLVEVEGVIDNQSVQSCYENIRNAVSNAEGYAKPTLRNGKYFLDILADSGEECDDFVIEYESNVQDATRDVSCEQIITGIFVRGKDSEDASAAYNLTLKNLDWDILDSAENLRFFDNTKRLLYIGPGEQSPDHTYNFETGKVYYHSGIVWIEDEEAVVPIPQTGFYFDKRTGILWHDAARKAYGSVVKYYEVDVTKIPKESRMQYMCDMAANELRSTLILNESIEISFVDPRLIRESNNAPILGNYYRVNIPLLKETAYLRLAGISTNIAKQRSDGKLTLGRNQKKLTDYAAKKE